MGVGFDTGTKGTILSVGNDKTVDVGGKDVSAKGVINTFHNLSCTVNYYIVISCKQWNDLELML